MFIFHVQIYTIPTNQLLTTTNTTNYSIQDVYLGGDAVGSSN